MSKFHMITINLTTSSNHSKSLYLVEGTKLVIDTTIYFGMMWMGTNLYDYVFVTNFAISGNKNFCNNLSHKCKHYCNLIKELVIKFYTFPPIMVNFLS